MVPDGTPGPSLKGKADPMPNLARSRAHHHRSYRNHRSYRSLLLASVTLGALFAPALGKAEPLTEHRHALLVQADRALAEHRPLEALTAWRAAWNLEPTYPVACNIGRVALRYGSASEAATFLTRCDRLAPKTETPDAQERQAAQHADLTEALRKVTTLRINTTKLGAQITVDGEPAGVSPLTEDVFLSPGDHRIIARLDGHDPAVESLRTEAGETTFVTLRLKETVKMPTPPTLTRPSTRSPWPAIGTASATFIGLAAGTAFTLASNAASTSADNAVSDIRHGIARNCEAGSASPACKDYESAAQSRQTYGAIAAGSFIGAGIAGVATVILVFFPDAPITPKTGANGGLSVSLW